MADNLSQMDMLANLLEGIDRLAPSLGVEARSAVNEGTDREETHSELDPKTQKRKEHKFRKRVPLTTEEALDKVLDLLTNRLVGLPLAINAVQKELNYCLPKMADSQLSSQTQLDEKIAIEIELGGAGDLLRDGGLKAQELQIYSQLEIEKSKSQIDALREMLGRGVKNDN